MAKKSPKPRSESKAARIRMMFATGKLTRVQIAALCDCKPSYVDTTLARSPGQKKPARKPRRVEEPRDEDAISEHMQRALGL